MRTINHISFIGLLLIFTTTGYSQKLIDEDFTDSIIDDYGSGVNGSNWHIYGPGTAFRRTNGRPFTYGLSNRIQAGGGGWADGAQWYIGADDSVYFKVHKIDDVSLVRFTTFSDYCYKNNFGGIEVAMLEYRDSLAPPPDYGHDQSWETMNCYYTPPGKGGCSNQMETNVENTDAAGYCSIAGINYAHKNNYYAIADLDSTQTGLVLWRNKKDIKKVNIEQWGNVNHGDFMIDTHMVSKLDPTNEYSLFSYVQVTFFRGQATQPASQYIQRSGIPYDQIQIGIAHLEVGITKNSDFNLDYTTDSADIAILAANNSATGALAHMQSGDADNNDSVNLFDGLQVIAFWNDTAMAPSAAGKYNPVTGEVLLDLNNISYFHLEGPAGVFSGTAADFSSLNAQLTLDNNNNIGAITNDEWNVTSKNLGAVAATGQSPSNLFVVVNYKGSNNRSGFRIPLDSTVFVGGTNIKTGDSPVFYPNPASNLLNIKCPSCFSSSTTTTIIDGNGKPVFKKTGIIQSPLDISSLPAGIYIAILNNGNVTLQQRIIITR